MAHENIQNQEVNLVLSSDAKPRLKWTSELHQRFVDSVSQLGGPESEFLLNFTFFYKILLLGFHKVSIFFHLQKRHQNL